MRPDEIDSQIIAHAKRDWQKVAMIIAKVGQPTNTNYDDIASRIGALVADGKLESHGDITKWRSSEVRLPEK